VVLSGERKTENDMLLAERFGTFFLIGLYGDVTMEGQNSHRKKLKCQAVIH
jgi:hypothetical protein